MPAPPLVPDQKMTRARTALLISEPWFGSLSLRLAFVSDESVQTCATDGTHLFYAPSFIEHLTDLELRGVVAHEVLHCALLHPYRLAGRNSDRWNIACDHAINLILTANPNYGVKFTLPSGALADRQYANQSAEQIYPKIKQSESVCKWGAVKPAPSGKSGQNGQPQPGMSATDWQVAVEQATAVARKAGKLPGDASAAAREAREVLDDPWEILKQFVERSVPTDHSWSHPNRRFISHGLYLPGPIKENIGPLGIALDTSGSVWSGRHDLLALFCDHVSHIVREYRPESIEVVYCDTRVQRAETFTPDDDVVIKPMGGGGTSFQPALDYFTNLDTPPIAVIYLTDLEASAPSEPDYPVLWCAPEGCTERIPFGECIYITTEQRP